MKPCTVSLRRSERRVHYSTLHRYPQITYCVPDKNVVFPCISNENDHISGRLAFCLVSKYWRSEPDFVEAMEVYEFMHGEKVVRQGDTDGAPRPHGPTPPRKCKLHIGVPLPERDAARARKKLQFGALCARVRGGVPRTPFTPRTPFKGNLSKEICDDIDGVTVSVDIVSSVISDQST